MKLSELIAAVGDDRIGLQMLDQCAISFDFTTKHGTKITFGTPEPLTPDGTVRLGIVVWLDRAAVAALVAREKEAGVEVEIKEATTNA
jgi:hypothetical protein